MVYVSTFYPNMYPNVDKNHMPYMDCAGAADIYCSLEPIQRVQKFIHTFADSQDTSSTHTQGRKAAMA